MEAYKKIIWGSTVVIVFLIIPLVIYFFFIKPAQVHSPRPLAPVSETAAADSKSAGDSSPQKAAAGEEELALTPFAADVSLNDSDSPVRELLGDCSSHPDFPRWLGSENIIRRCVAVVDNIAEGNSPAVHLRFLEPSLAKKFAVIRRKGKIIVDPESYRRYDVVTSVLFSIRSETLAAHYRQLRPLLEEAYRELGKPGQTFQETLEQALDLLLETPIPQGDVLLEEKVTTYAFADPRLEGLTPAQKHLLRMGPANIRIIREKLTEIKEKLMKKTGKTGTEL
jgi:hypothetical protein